MPDADLAKVQSTFEYFDCDGNGCMDGPEFTKMAAELADTTERDISGRQAFREIDADGSGFVEVVTPYPLYLGLPQLLVSNAYSKCSGIVVSYLYFAGRIWRDSLRSSKSCSCGGLKTSAHRDTSRHGKRRIPVCFSTNKIHTNDSRKQSCSYLYGLQESPVMTLLAGTKTER